MIDIITPQRFYQYSFIDQCKTKIATVIDLKEVTEITMVEGERRKDIFLNLKNGCQPRPLVIGETEVASEVFAKIVTAWTTYKLATER